jgi:hypothetical protein
MIWRYVKEISRIWFSWIFALSTILGIITQITNKNIPFYPWVYWVVAVLCFIVANCLLFVHQEKIIKNYEAEEAYLKLIVIDSEISFRDSSLTQIFVGNGPFDRLNDLGMPINLFLVANVEIENFGKDIGVFEWEISSIELGNIFIPDPEDPKSKFVDFSSEIKGRERFSGKWELKLQPCKPDIKGFAEILKNPTKYKAVLNYQTRKIGGRSNSQSVVISGDFSNFVNEIAAKWEERGLGHFARIALNKQ